MIYWILYIPTHLISTHLNSSAHLSPPYLPIHDITSQEKPLPLAKKNE